MTYETVAPAAVLNTALLCIKNGCRLRSIAAHGNHFVRRLSVRPSVCVSVRLSGSHTFLVVTHSYDSQETPSLCLILDRENYAFNGFFCFNISFKSTHFMVFK